MFIRRPGERREATADVWLRSYTAALPGVRRAHDGRGGAGLVPQGGDPAAMRAGSRGGRTIVGVLV